MDQYTDHGFCHAVYVSRDRGESRMQHCDNAARFHYRSTTGEVVKLCGRHANAEIHRWKNPRPIHESV